jgi:hypothetical protein
MRVGNLRSRARPPVAQLPGALAQRLRAVLPLPDIGHVGKGLPRARSRNN